MIPPIEKIWYVVSLLKGLEIEKTLQGPPIAWERMVVMIIPDWRSTP